LWKTIIYFLVLLTFFSLWVFFSDSLEKIYVKNYLIYTYNKNGDDILKSYEEIKKENLNSFISSININNKDYLNNNQNNKDYFLDLNLYKFKEIYSIVKNNYYDSDTISNIKIEEWIIRGFIESLWDKHSEYMSSSETKEFNATLNWDFEWIWARVDKTPIWVKIETLIKGSPALKSWLLKDDIIIEADWFNLADLSLYDAVSKIKWKAWTKVLLKILRVWEDWILEIKLTREKIKIPSVEVKEFKWFEDIWYIALNQFWVFSSKEFLIELNKFKDKKWIIIDLRDNGWWLLSSAVEILSSFVENGEVLVITKYKNIENEVYKSSNNWIYNWKIVILINWNSASASEITAWALKDYSKAILIWEKTYWKWSVQNAINLFDGSSLKLTIAKWFTPKDVNIDTAWIMPDITIQNTKKDYENKYDRQLEEAKKLLKKFIKKWDILATIQEYKKENNISLSWSLLWTWIINK